MKSAQSFEQKTKNSFAQMRDEMDLFRRSMNEWIMHLDSELIESKERILRLEAKVEELEARRRLGL